VRAPQSHLRCERRLSQSQTIAVSFTIQCMRGIGACFTKAEIPVNNSSLQCDPAPGLQKRLRVAYRIGLNETVIEAPEGSTMYIPQGSGRRYHKH